MKGKLTVLMITAFVDMLGLAMIIPLLPFSATEMGASASVVGVLIAAFSIASWPARRCGVGFLIDTVGAPALGFGFPFVVAGMLVLGTLSLTASMEDYATPRARSVT